MKSYEELTIVMCCNIVAKVCLWTRSGILKKKSFSKIIITLLPRLRPTFRECVTSIIFQELLFFCLAGGGPQLKISLRFFCLKKKKSKTLWWLVINRKKFCLVKFNTMMFSRSKVYWIKPFISGFLSNSIEYWAPTGQPHCLLQP